MSTTPRRTYMEILEQDPTVRAHLTELLRTAAGYCESAPAVHRELLGLANVFCDHVRIAPDGHCRYCRGEPFKEAD